jgi:hypothetical protein
MNVELSLGQIVEMKKTHPCGATQWKIIRIGADVKIQCLGCSRIVMLDRQKFLKNVKKFINSGEKD